jgi:hypothetical protein
VLVILLAPDMLFGREPIPRGDEDEAGVSIPGFEKIPDWLWLSGQANFIAQMHPAFHALYSGLPDFQWITNPGYNRDRGRCTCLAFGYTSKKC